MTYQLRVLTLVALMLFSSKGFAQIFPVDANAVLIPPNSLKLSDYALDRSQDLMINITLNDPVEPFLDVTFRVTISNNGTEILRTSDSFLPNPVRLDQFATLSLTGFDIADYLDFTNLTAINGYTHTGLLPEGLNSICIEVIAADRPDVVVSRQACASGYAVLNDPPFPQLPGCGEIVEHIGAQNIMFTWLPMHLGSPNNVSNVQYQFTLVKVEEGYNPFEAMEAAQPMFQTVTANTSLVLQDPLLEDDNEYAWQVKAFDPFDATVENLFKNQGLSQVCTFTYQEHEFPDVSELYAQDDDISSECSASCLAEIPTNSNLISDLGLDDVVKVGKFLMTVTEVTSQSGDYFTGKGFIFIPFLLSNMNVTFTDMAVNTDNVMFAGEVATDIDSDLVTDDMSSESGSITASADDIDNLNSYIDTEGRKVSQMDDRGSSLGLPLAIDKTIGGIDYNVIITGLSFDRDQANLNAVMSIEDPESGNGIAFGSKGICFHPYGVGGVGAAELYLFEDFSLGDYSEFDLTFKAPGDDNDGTYVSFDCQGFVELNIEAEYEFPQDMLSSPDSSDPVVASFSINTPEWGQFIASTSVDPFEIVGLEGYTFTIENAFFDYSDDGNPDDVEFPEDYDDTGDDWKGFFLSTMSITLPDDLSASTGELSFGAENVLIDNSGVSGDIFASGILDLQSGRLAEWAFSIDTVRLSVVSNSLSEGQLLGEIHVPIMSADNSLEYEGLMTPTDDGVDLQFAINPSEDIEVDMWAATLALENSSNIAVTKTSDGFVPYAELNGNMSMSLEIQAGNEFSFEAMAFEGFKINHPDESRRLTVDAFSLFGGGSGFGGGDDGGDDNADDEDPQESLSGFPISFSNVNFTGSGDDSGINFDLNLNLTGEELGIAATTNLTVTGEYNAQGAPFNAWRFKGVELNSLDVDADIGAVAIVGSVTIYNSDETYGDGFKGMLSATFTPVGQLDALAQFGKIDGYRYFFVDAKILSTAPFVDVLGLGLYGFGGGVYYHMTRNTDPPDLDLEGGVSGFDDSSEPGVSLSGVTYTPDNSVLIGLKATMIAGVQPGGSSMSADLTFEISFRKTNNFISVNQISFDGDAYFMSPSLLERDESQVYAGMRATLDIDNNRLVASLDAHANVGNGVIEGSGQAAILLSDDEWYIYFGTPDNPVRITVASVATFNVYFDMGTTVPSMPNLRDVVPGYDGSTSNQRPSSNMISSGAAIIFGGSFTMESKRYTFGSFYASAGFGMGFDVYLRKVVAANCGAATGTIGIDGWYLSGQAYAYGHGEIGLKVNTWFYEGNVKILSLSGSVVIQAELPNPSWLKGEVHVDYRILGGAIKGKVDFKFEVGSRCEFDEDPLSGIVVLSDIDPGDNETEVSVLASPAVAASVPLNQSFTITSIDDDGDTKTEYYMPVLTSFTIEPAPIITKRKVRSGGGFSSIARRAYGNVGNTRTVTTTSPPTAPVPNTVQTIADDGYSAELYLKELLEPYTRYTISATVQWKKKTSRNGSWSWVDDATESKTATYTTGPRPDFLPDEAIAYAKPLMDRRNMYHTDNSWFYVLTGQTGWDYLFEDTDFQYYMKFENLTDGGEERMQIRYEDYKYGTGIVKGYSSRMRNFINNHRGKVFKGSIVAVYEGADKSDLGVGSKTENRTEGVQVTTKSITTRSTGNVDDKLIYDWYFRTSMYDNALDKWNDIEATTGTYMQNDIRLGDVVGSMYRRNFVPASTGERFDIVDREGYRWQGGNVIVKHNYSYKYLGIDWDTRDSQGIEEWEEEQRTAEYLLARAFVLPNFIPVMPYYRQAYSPLFQALSEPGNGSYVRWWYNKDLLTDNEKDTGQPAPGYERYYARNSSLIMKVDAPVYIKYMKRRMYDLLPLIWPVTNESLTYYNLYGTTNPDVYTGPAAGLKMKFEIKSGGNTYNRNLELRQ